MALLLRNFVSTLLRASFKKASGPAPSIENINRNAAKDLRVAGFKADAGDVRLIRRLIERYNPEILPEGLRLVLPVLPAETPQSDNVVYLRGEAK
jgi:hypothetical protein